MKEIIKRYPAKSGEVTITKYEENGNIEYRVKHSNQYSSVWYKDRTEAIKEAQFLAGKY